MMTLLPAQLFRLALITLHTEEAVGLIQIGSVILVDTGDEQFRIDAKGDRI